MHGQLVHALREYLKTAAPGRCAELLDSAIDIIEHQANELNERNAKIVGLERKLTGARERLAEVGAS